MKYMRRYRADRRGDRSPRRRAAAGRPAGTGQPPSRCRSRRRFARARSERHAGLRRVVLQQGRRGTLLVGYFNRNTKQELDIPVGPNNRIEPGGPDHRPADALPVGPLVGRVHDQGAEGLRRQEADVDARRQRPHQRDHDAHQARLDPRAVRGSGEQEHAAGSALRAEGPSFTGPPEGVAATIPARSANRFKLAAWATDEGAKINVPPATGRRPGPGGAAPPNRPQVHQRRI